MTQHNNIQRTTAYLQSLEPELNLDHTVLEQSLQHMQVKQTLAIKILSIFGGTLSSATFFGFLLIAGLHKSNIALSILGILAIATSIIIGKKFKQILWDTISVSTFSIGFIMLGMALSEFLLNEQYTALCCAVLSFICLSLRPNYIISFVATLILNGSLLSYILSTQRDDLIHIQVSLLAILLTYFFLKEAQLLQRSFKIGLSFHAVRTGLLLSFLIGLGLLRQDLFFNLSGSWSWSTSTVCTLSIFFLCKKLLTDLGLSDLPTKLSVFVLTLLIIIPTILFPGIAGSILLILLCFGVNYKTGFVMGILALLWFVGKFYYDLNYTLLTKSIMLVASGIVFLLFYLFISRRTNHEKI